MNKIILAVLVLFAILCMWQSNEIHKFKENSEIKVIDATGRLQWEYHQNRSALYERAIRDIHATTMNVRMRRKLEAIMRAFHEQDSIFLSCVLRPDSLNGDTECYIPFDTSDEEYP